MVNISAITLGNHELYNDATIDYIAANHTDLFGDRFKYSFLFSFLFFFLFDIFIGFFAATSSTIIQMSTL